MSVISAYLKCLSFLLHGEVAAYHREELDVQNQRSVEEPAKKFLELCLIHKHDKPDSEASLSLAVFADRYNSKTIPKKAQNS
ncbi:hypothetical protein Bca4012_048856 [Brassica carinata]